MGLAIVKKISVVGLGSIGRRHLANIKILHPDARVLAVSSSGVLPDAPVAHADQLSVDIQAAIDFKPDFAIVASPATYHFQHAKQFMAANIPVLIEKPITADLNEANQLISLTNQSDVPVSVGYCLRYLPAMSHVKKLLQDMRIGNIYNIFVHVGQFLPLWRQNKDYRLSVSASKKLGGGVLLELSHELDYLQWLVGELDFSYGILRNTKKLNLEVEEIADLMLTTTCGKVCHVHLDFVQKNTQRYCCFIGENGRIDWDLLKNKVSISTEKEERIVFNDPSWDRNNMYLLMLQDFIDSVEKKEKKHALLMDAQRTVELIDKIKSNVAWGVSQ